MAQEINGHTLLTKETCDLQCYHHEDLPCGSCPVCEGSLSVCRDCGTYEAGLDEPCTARRFPIYLCKKQWIKDLPPERYYSTVKDREVQVVGYVVSPHPLRSDYQGTYGATYSSPDKLESGFYPVRSLVECAREGRNGWVWEPVGDSK